jgi:predicted site-specific integrase-resolvase
VSDLLNQTGLAKALGISVSTVNRLTDEGVIIPEIHEGKVFRYDLEQVRTDLKARARKKAAASLA